MKIRSAIVWMIIAVAAFANVASAIDGKPTIKVVYHIDEGVDKAAFALANIRNHLKAEPATHIVVVANGPGVDFLVEGAKDRNGNPFDATVDDLVSQGVEFRVCASTLAAKTIELSQILQDAKPVASGVAEIARLQALEDFAYLRP